MFFPLTFLQILHSKIPFPGKLVKTRHIWRHDLQTESNGSRPSELIGDSCSRCERVDNSTSSLVELCFYKRAFRGGSRRNMPQRLVWKNWNGVSTGWWKSFMTRLTVSTQYRRVTDEQTSCDNIVRAMHASRGKELQFQRKVAVWNNLSILVISIISVDAWCVAICATRTDLTYLVVVTLMGAIRALIGYVSTTTALKKPFTELRRRAGPHICLSNHTWRRHRPKC